jgi:hypothetical protein
LPWCKIPAPSPKPGGGTTGKPQTQSSGRRRDCAGPDALWNAFNAVGPSNFGSVDLFDQCGAYTDWMSGVAYQSKFNSEQAAGKYPTRVEGFSFTGTPLYRAVFAPVPASVSAWQSRHGIDCPTYKSLDTTLRSERYENASLQSFVSNDGTRRYQATWVKW